MTTSVAIVVHRPTSGRKQLQSKRFRPEPELFVRHQAAHPIRSIDMSLFVEELARDRMRQAQRDAETYRLARRLRSARRAAARASR